MTRVKKGAGYDRRADGLLQYVNDIQANVGTCEGRVNERLGTGDRE
jgi:hypothetical protein